MSRANDDLLGLLVNETRDYAILTLDVDGNVATWYAGARRFKGYEADEIVGRHFSVFYLPQDVAAGKPQHELQAAAAAGRLEDEGWRVRRDGSRFWANVVITALRDSDGSLRGFGKVTRDLTERRAHEMALREREQLVSGVLSAATGCSIIATDLDGLITVFNSGAERMLGYRAQDLVGVHSPALIHDADEIVARAERLGIAPGFEVFVVAAQQGCAEIREWTYVCKDGSRLPVELTITAVLDDDQRPRGFVGIAVDLSERRRADAASRSAERSVRESEARMQALLEHAPIAISLRDLDGRLVLINRAGAESMGITVQEALAAVPQDFIDPRVHQRLEERERERLEEQERAIREGAAATTTEFTGPDAGGVEHHYLVTKYPVTDGSDTIVGVGGISIDITERRYAEQQLLASEENLRNVAAVARELTSHENPRQAICEAACVIAGADIVQLWEPDGATHLQVTAAIGTELSPELRVALIGEMSGTASVYHSGQRCIVLDTHASGAPVSIRMRELLGAASALYEPVLGRDGALGVLVVIWKTAITETRHRDVEAVGLLAIEAAVAIARADMTAQLHAMAGKDELRLRQLLEGAPDAMIICDAGGIIQTVNDQTQRLLGYTHDELVGESIDRLVPHSRRTGHAAHRAAFIAAPSTRAMGVERELHARHKDGHEIPVSITLSPVQTDDGMWAIAAVRDITERRFAEEQLRVAEEQFRRSFDDAPIGMTIVDLDGRFLQVNDAFCAILGHPRTTLVGLCSQAITHPDDLAQD
ncbi:MAG: PAS domain S-box protein, partial [Solirubrobacteraceae bacterium]